MPTPVTITLFAWSVVLLIVHITVQAGLALAERGLAWGAGSRGDGGPARDGAAGRAARALRNYLETYPAFVGLALVLAIVGAPPLALLGAKLWLGARVAYLPIYASGIPYVRTLAFNVSLVGLILMLVPLL